MLDNFVRTITKTLGRVCKKKKNYQKSAWKITYTLMYTCK